MCPATTTEADGLRLRRASGADAAAVLALKRNAYRRHAQRIGVEPLPMVADYARMIAEEEVWVAEDDGLCACLVLQRRPDHLVLWSIAVSPESGGRGIGRRLLAFAEERAKVLGLGEVRLFTNEKMTENQAWYARHGYRETGREELGGRKAVHMRKPLRAEPNHREGLPMAELGEALPGWTPRHRPPRTPLEGRFARLEPFDPRHARGLYDAFAEDRQGRIWTYMGYGPFAGFEEYEAWATGACTGDDPLFHTILDARTGAPLGVASYLRIDPANGVIEVGNLCYSPRLQRTPAATEAMFLMMRRAFDELGYRRYEWKCNALNAASRRAAERLGFTYEGTFRQHQVVKGRNRDTAWFSILDREWPARGAAFEAWLDPGNFDAEGRQKQSLEALRGGLEGRGRA